MIVKNPDETEKTAGCEDSSVRQTGECWAGAGATWFEIRLIVIC